MNTVRIVTLIGLITTASTQCMLLNKIKKATRINAQKAVPNIGAVIITLPILFIAQKYLGMSYTANPTSDDYLKKENDHLKKT